MQRLLRVKDVADRLGVTVARVYEMSRAGELPFLVRIGERTYRYNPELLTEWIASGGSGRRSLEVPNEKN